MLNIFQLKNNHLLRIKEENKIHSFNEIIWIDIIQSHNNYKNHHIQEILNQKKIKFFKLKDIKKNKRFFKNKNTLYIRSYFFSYNNNKNKINNSIVYFIIHNNFLYTIRERKLPTFYKYQQSTHNQLIINDNIYELLLNLFETKLNELTDEMEKIYSTLEQLSFLIMNEQKIDEHSYALSKLAKLENIGWKIRINLLDSERTIKFLLYKAKLPLKQKEYANKILQDIILLLPHNEYISHKVNLLTQTTMGFINIKQNRIIKIFSIIFLPPTLIASSYGMNFEFMPELHWPFGYPSAIILMILTGLAPYLYFKHKNWL